MSVRPLRILAGGAALVVGAALAWRFASRTRSLPCPTWLRWLVELDNPLTNVSRASTIVAGLDLEPGMRVLDAGSGPGRVTIPLARAVGPQGEVVALDLQAGMLNRVREKARGAGLANVHCVHAGLGEGTLEGKAFDRVVLVTVLGEIPDRAAAMREIFEALRPSGLLSVTEVIFDPHFQSRGAVVRLAESTGFRAMRFSGGRFAYSAIFEKPGAGHSPEVHADAGADPR